MHHLFVHLVRSTQDPFAGLRQNIVKDGGTFDDIRFDAAELDLIDSVEYTRWRPLRFWLYRTLFRNFEERLDTALAKTPGPVCVYLADEGVWAVLWEQYRRRTGRRNIRAVNVQHGFALLRPASHRWLRYLLNLASVSLTGYPAIGYGSVGGAGPGPFDVYLTYDQPTADFAVQQSDRSACPAPRLIKHELISQFAASHKPSWEKRVLFTMNIAIAGSPVLFTSEQTYQELIPVAASLKKHGFELVIRLHPGMDREKEALAFSRHPISGWATLDQERALHKSMAACSIVMSYLSTSLWEGSLLGLLPVQLIGQGCRPVDLGYPVEKLDVGTDIDGQIAGICQKIRPKGVFDWAFEEEKEWTQVKPLLWGEAN